jgi:hypothetical protein
LHVLTGDVLRAKKESHKANKGYIYYVYGFPQGNRTQAENVKNEKNNISGGKPAKCFQSVSKWEQRFLPRVVPL